MTVQPWDLPTEEASRSKLEDLIRKYEAEKMPRELGICCSRMAGLLKHIGPMSDAVEYAQGAIWYLRKTDDKKELARALRVACLPFTSGPHKEWLEESLAISREIGDRTEEAWTIYRLTRPLSTGGKSIEDAMATLMGGNESDIDEMMKEIQAATDKSYKIEDALAIFEEIDDKVGQAVCLVSLGVERKPHDRSLFERGTTLYEEVGDKSAAEKARQMADAFCSEST